MELLRLIETIRTPFLEFAAGLVTRLGEETVAVVVLCAVFWCINKRAAYGIGVAFFFSGLTVQGMKVCFRIERPWVADPSLRPVASAMDKATGYSFPSGHTQCAAALFGSLGVQTKRKTARALCFSAVLLVAFSRVYLGVHTPLDVVASLLVSSLFILLTAKLISGETTGKKAELVVALAMAAFAVIVIAVAAGMYSAGKIGHDYVADYVFTELF